MTLTLGQGHKMLPSTHHVTYAPVMFEVATSKSLGGYLFTRKTLYDLDLGVNLGIKVVTQNVAQYSQRHVTYAPSKVEVAASSS